MVNITTDMSIDITNNTPVQGTLINKKGHYTESPDSIPGNGGTAHLQVTAC